MIEAPSVGIDLDVKRAGDLFAQVQWQQNPPAGGYHARDYRRQDDERKMLSIMDGSHAETAAREAKVWGGAKPKTLEELRAWADRNGDEPEPENDGEDEDGMDFEADGIGERDGEDGGSMPCDSKKRRLSEFPQ